MKFWVGIAFTHLNLTAKMSSNESMIWSSWKRALLDGSEVWNLEMNAETELYLLSISDAEAELKLQSITDAEAGLDLLSISIKKCWTFQRGRNSTKNKRSLKHIKKLCLPRGQEEFFFSHGIRWGCQKWIHVAGDPWTVNWSAQPLVDKYFSEFHLRSR